MRRAHVRTTASAMAAAVLCQGNGSLQTGASQHTGYNQHDFSQDRTAKEKARHKGTLPAASEIEAARFARIRYTQV
jgi:hypothetical protein